MPSRTLNVTDEAYAVLAAQKQPGESFTDVIKRLAGHRSLFEVVGVLDDAQAAKLAERVAAGRERAKRRRQKQLRW